MIEPLYTTVRPEKPEGCWFDEDAAQKAVGFFARLKHTQGRLAGEPFILSEEQRWVTREMFGWKRPDGLRLIRTVYVEMGRGNGKSQWAAGLAGKLLFADGEANPDVQGAAVDRDQAKIVLNRLKAMVRANRSLAARSRVYQKEIQVPKTGAVYRAVSADVSGAWGGAPSGVVFDEVHAQRNRDLWDALVTGTGKRAQPLVIALTTAGWDRTSLAWELHEYTRQLAQGLVEDPTFLGVVWAAAEEDDWTSPAVWRKANPHLGIAFEESFLEQECQRAKAIPAFQNTFRTLYLSQWVGQSTRFIDMGAWDECGAPINPPERRVAFGGLDLASTTDLAAYVAVTADEDGAIEVHPRLFLPQEDLRERSRRDRVPYDLWAEQGFLTTTPGAVIDYSYIKQAVLESAAQFDLQDVGYDKWNSSQLVQDLEAEGLSMVQIGQGYASLSAPTKELLRMVLERKVRHGGNPLLRWMANNAAAQTDAAGNIKPDKSRSAARIDGIVALIMALDGQMRRGRVARRVSVYEERGLLLAP